MSQTLFCNPVSVHTAFCPIRASPAIQGSVHCKSTCCACLRPYSCNPVSVHTAFCPIRASPALTQPSPTAQTTVSHFFKLSTSCLYLLVETTWLKLSNALYSVDWWISPRTQDLALCSSIHLHQMHQQMYRKCQMIFSVHCRLRPNIQLCIPSSSTTWALTLMGIHRILMRKWCLHLQVLLHSQPQPTQHNLNTQLKLHHSLYLGSLGWLWWDHHLCNSCLLRYLGRFTGQGSNQILIGFRAFNTLMFHLKCSK